VKRTRSPWTLLVAAASVLAACSCPKNEVLVDDFEGCTGTCGWTVSGPGTARLVSTILPGEHGLAMDGGVTAEKTIPVATIDPTYSLLLVASCPAGMTASLAATVAGTGDVSLPVMLALDTSLTPSGDPPDYSGASYVPLTGTLTFPGGVMSAAVHQVTLQPAAGGTCTVDLLRLSATTPCGG
jgi:hypothetical protein